MKALYLLVTLTLIGTNLALAVEEVAATLENELKHSGETLRRDLIQSKRKLAKLKEQQSQIQETVQKQAALEKEGTALMKDYSTVVMTRYVDPKGDYQSGYEISAKDQEYINRLVGKFLRAHPLAGRTSAGEAIRALNWAMSRLSELASTHAAPSEMNNSDLEIVATQMKELDSYIRKQISVATRLGVTVPTADEVEERQPAAKPESKADEKTAASDKTENKTENKPENKNGE